MNFVHLLPRVTQVVTDRQAFIAELCRNKNVLHLGCVDAGLTQEAIEKGNFLQAKIAKVANIVVGIDNDIDGLSFLEKQKNDREKFYSIDIEKINSDTIEEKIDVVVAGEVLEHLSNVGTYLRGMRELLVKNKAKMIITVPNAFSIRHFWFVMNGREIVHPDHNYYFSYATLGKLMEKYSLAVIDICVYNTPNLGIEGSLLYKVRELCRRHIIRYGIRRSPFFSEGLIFVVEPG